MRIAREKLINNLTNESSVAYVEDYIDRYLKSNYGDRPWVKAAFDLDAAFDDYRDGQRRCREIQNEVIIRLSQAKDVQKINAFIDDAVSGVVA